jgi:tetratricopeptide (TPR) repeat protein
VIALDKRNPLAYHYLGKILYWQKRWEEADIIFNYASTYYLGESAFKRYTDSMSKHLSASKSRNCIINEFRQSQYDRIDDHYFLASLYEAWNHFNEAEKHYRTVIAFDPNFIGGYYKLWQMFERNSRYEEAEDVLRAYASRDSLTGSRELNNFYKRMMQRYPGEVDWFYKGGLLLYQIAANNPNAYQADRKQIAPDTDEEAYIISKRDSTEPEGVYRPHSNESLPGTMESIIFSDVITYPRTEAINYLRKVDSLIQDDSARADVNSKIGDLYVWQGIPERSLPYYKRSIDLGTANANSRMKFIEVCDLTYHLSDALEQLDTLYDRHQINFSKQVLLAKYCIHSGRFADALKLLDSAEKIHPYKVAEIVDLKGRLQLLSHHPNEALPYYMQYLKTDSTNCLTMYSIARINAQLKNMDEAAKWLKLSVNKGFKYYWVLKYDPAWDDYRRSPTWKQIIAKVPVPVITDTQPAK